MSGLAGKRIALLEARFGSELAKLIERYGGVAYNAPALREATIDCGAEVDALINKLSSGDIQFIVFQTGVGLATLIGEAEKLGRKDELLAALKNTTTVCRGPKPTAVMARHGLRPSVATSEPYTTTELLEAMAPLELAGKSVAVLHYGERNAALAEALKERGAKLDELCLYEWQMPEDTAPLKNLIQELNQGAFDVVAFTSQIQARHLFQIAAESGREEEVRNALNEKTVVASIGPTCTAALDKLGVKPKVEPKNPKMAPMVQALTEYFNKQ